MAKDNNDGQASTIKRRQFIKNTATLATGAAVAGSAVPGAR